MGAIFAVAGISDYNQGRKLQEQLDLGERYLGELDYEAAIAAYEMAIEIDPKSVDAYLGLADVYVEMKKYEDAIDVLKDGYDETEDEELLDAIEEIEEMMEDAESLDGEEVESDDKNEQSENEEESSFVPGSVEVSVEDAYTYYNITDEYGFQQIYHIHIPQVSLNGNSDLEINKEIYDIYFDEDYSFWPSVEIAYSYNIKDEMFSILMKNSYSSDYSFRAFNISAKTGEVITDLDLLAAYGYTDESLKLSVQPLLEEELQNHVKPYVDEELYHNCLEETLSCNDIKPYIDENGDLCIAAPIYNGSARSFYYKLFNISGNTEPTEPACTVNHDEAE